MVHFVLRRARDYSPIFFNNHSKLYVVVCKLILDFLFQFDKFCTPRLSLEFSNKLHYHEKLSEYSPKEDAFAGLPSYIVEFASKGARSLAFNTKAWRVDLS